MEAKPKNVTSCASCPNRENCSYERHEQCEVLYNALDPNQPYTGDGKPNYLIPREFNPSHPAHYKNEIAVSQIESVEESMPNVLDSGQVGFKHQEGKRKWLGNPEQSMWELTTTDTSQYREPRREPYCRDTFSN